MIKSEIAAHLLVTVVSFIILTISSIASAETQGIATTKKVESILDVTEIKNGIFFSLKSDKKLEIAFLKFFIVSSF